MLLNSRAALLAAILCTALPPLGARAAGPAALAQAGPGTAPDQGAVRNPNPKVSNDSPSGVSPNPNNNTTGAGTSGQGALDIPLPTSAPPRVGLFPDFGKSLLGRGIDFHGITFDHFVANPSAGIKTGELNNLGVLAPAVDIDLQKLTGLIPGGNIHAQATFFGLKGDIPTITAKTGGFLTGFQTTPAVMTHVVSVLTYEQKMFNDKLSVELGRTNPYRFFFLPNAIDFFNGYSSVVQATGDFNSNPYPNWGGRVTYHFTPEWYVQGGSFVTNFHNALFNGDNFGVAGNSGFSVIGELGYRSEFNNAAYPANFEAGFLFDERHGSRTNLKGTGIPANRFTTTTNYGNGGALFLQGLKVLYRGERGAYGPPKNISVYGSINQSVDQPQPFQFDTLIGMNFTGFVAGRPLDALGLQAHLSRLSNTEAKQETAYVRRFEGPGSTATQQRNGFAFEAVYAAQVTPYMVVRPFVQYFVNPDTYYNRGPHPFARDGFAAGVFATVPLGRLLGTSEKAF